jgi:hypothetical protein
MSYVDDEIKIGRDFLNRQNPKKPLNEEQIIKRYWNGMNQRVRSGIYLKKKIRWLSWLLLFRLLKPTIFEMLYLKRVVVTLEIMTRAALTWKAKALSERKRERILSVAR